VCQIWEKDGEGDGDDELRYEMIENWLNKHYKYPKNWSRNCERKRDDDQICINQISTFVSCLFTVVWHYWGYWTSDQNDISYGHARLGLYSKPNDKANVDDWPTSDTRRLS